MAIHRDKEEVQHHRLHHDTNDYNAAQNSQ